MSNVTTWLQNAEALCIVFAAQRKVYQETKVWFGLSIISQNFILVQITLYGLNIPSSPPQSINHFLNERNSNVLQAGCVLTYAGNNIYLKTSF